MAVRKSDLYQSIWESCDELRGGMDASQYKDYVLVLLFVKYVSDRYRNGGVIQVPKGGGFDDMVSAKGQKDIGERINKILSTLAEANALAGVVDATDFNDPTKLGSGKEMVDRLTNLIAIFENPALDFASNRADGDDLLGDAYEYLMRHFATESGKAKGQFYTPAEVSRILAAVVGVERAADNKQSIYDPTCGSGSLLLKAHDAAKKATGLDLAIYGQEKDNATANLAKMNMVLHDAPTAVIEQGNTLSDPKWKNVSGGLKKFDYAVANPPFSTKSWKSGLKPETDEYGRFVYGIPPDKNGDYAFLLHVLASLKSTGTGAVIMPHGVLFRGHSEERIRKNLVDRGYIKAVIGLPANLFYGTGIPACILVLDKKYATDRTGIFMIEASKGFTKDGAKNRLRERDIHRIIDVYSAQKDIPGYSRMVPSEEISSETNDYNLNLPRYIDTSEPEDIQDIEAHLEGGIPNRDIDDLESYWEVMRGLRGDLFEPERPGYSRLRTEIDQIGDQIRSHPEFAAFSDLVDEACDGWQERARKQLIDIDAETRAPEVARILSEDLLETFRPVPLIDEYAVYQRFMEYWDETMKDDVYLVSELGWEDAAKPQNMAPKKKGEKNRPEPDFVIGSGRNKAEYRSELLSAKLMIHRFLADEQAKLESALEAEADAKARIQELEEEHATADGLLSEVINDKGNITKPAVSTRIEELEEDDEERAVLEKYREANTAISAARDRVRSSATALANGVRTSYSNLDSQLVQKTAVDFKWLDQIAAETREEKDTIARSLSTRIEELGSRYAEPLAELSEKASNLRARVLTHLSSMGFET